MKEINNRIEEVKKIARSMITASHYDNLDDVAFDSYIKEICSLFPQPLDDKELREKIAIAIFDWDYEGINTWEQNCIGKHAYYLLADHILALLPSIEEARREEQDRLLGYLKGLLGSTPKASLAATIDLIETTKGESK